MAESRGPGNGEAAALFASRNGRRAFVLDEREVVNFLRITVEQEGGQSAFARLHGVPASNVNRILNGRARVTKSVAKALGLRRVYVAE
jgi:hypothetical protein